jgi:hypothetical protein
MPWKNRYLEILLTGIGKLLFGCRCGDFHCGLRGFSAAAFRRMELQTTGMEFASEMVIRHGARHEHRRGPHHARSRRQVAAHLRPCATGGVTRFMLLFSRWLFVYPGAILMTLGAITVAWLLPGPRAVGGIVLDVHSLLYGAAAILLGFQAVLFGVLANGFAVMHNLIPKSGYVKLAYRLASLEAGILLGLALIAGGFVGSIIAVWTWKEHAFGALDPSQTLRIAIPSVLAMVLGSQIVLASFFLDVMRLHVRSRSTSTGGG